MLQIAIKENSYGIFLLKRQRQRCPKHIKEPLRCKLNNNDTNYNQI